MIGEVLSRRRDGRSSFQQLQDYIESHADAVFASENIVCPETAAAEMKSAADFKPDTKDPVYHMILSWPEGERPTRDQARMAAERMVERLGFDGHQWMAALHTDTGNQHVHLMVNRVHPDTKRVHNPRMDFLTIDRTCRELEIEQGWTHDRGPHVVEYVDDRAYILRREKREREPRIAKAAANFERYTGDVSFQSWVGQGQVRALMDGADTWRDLHARLEAVGLELQEVTHRDRAGLVIVDKEDQSRAAKASQAGAGCGMNDLVTRLGAYEPSYDQWLAADHLTAELTKNDAVFTERTVRDLVETYTPNAAEQARLADMILRSEDVIALQGNDPAALRFTTKAVLTEEKAILDAAASMAKQDGPVAREDAVRAVLDRRAMREDQLSAFTGALEAGRVAVWQGRAGVGKSYGMNAVREAYEASGCEVIGLAPTNAVVSDMQADGFKEASTLHRALNRIERDGSTWSERTVLIVDEAGMTDHATLARFMTAAEEAGAKVLLVGDSQQLSAVGRGGIFEVLAARHGAGEITEITRQRTDWQRQAAMEFSQGAFERGMRRYHENDRITWSGSDAEARERLVEAWRADTAQGDGRTRFVFAYTNADVDDLNRALRQVRKDRGELGAEMESATSHGAQTFAVNDRVIISETDRRLGVLNGMMGTVTGVDPETYTLRFRPDGRADEISLTLGKREGQFGGIRHGYAGTIHKGQGRTLDQTYLLHTSHWRDAASYVALSRQKEDAAIFASREAATDYRDLAWQMRRDGKKTAASRLTVADKPDHLAPDPVQDAAPKPDPSREEAGTSRPDQDAPRSEAPSTEPSPPEARRIERQAHREQLRQEWKQEQQSALLAHQTAWRADVQAWREKRDAAVSVLKEAQGRERKALWAHPPKPGDRKTQAAALFERHRAARLALRAELRAERDQIGAAPRRETWEDFVKRRAADNDPRAQAALRGMKYRDQREERAALRESESARAGLSPASAKSRDASKPEQDARQGREAELDRMARIDLLHVMRERGWTRDASEVAADPDGIAASQKWRDGADLLIVKTENGQGVRYFNPNAETDNGSVIAFVQKDRTGARAKTLGEARVALRPYLAQPALSRARDDTSASHQPGWDQTEARKHWDGADRFTTQRSGYAEKRGLDPEFLRRYSDHVRLDRSGNLLMAHRDSTGTLTGYEIKGVDFEGFATDGSRSAFAIGSDSPRRIVITESGMEALSAAQLEEMRWKDRGDAAGRPGDTTLYVSLGGALGKRQEREISHLIEKNPDARLEVGFAQGERGDDYVERLQSIVGERALEPVQRSGEGWNQALLSEHQAQEAFARNSEDLSRGR